MKIPAEGDNYPDWVPCRSRLICNLAGLDRDSCGTGIGPARTCAHETRHHDTSTDRAVAVSDRPHRWATTMAAQRLDLAHFLLQTASFPFAEATPNAKTFVVGQRIFEAIASNLTGQTNLFGFSGGSSLFWEERFWISLSTKRSLLPGHLFAARKRQLYHLSHRGSLLSPSTERQSRTHLPPTEVGTLSHSGTDAVVITCM